MSDADSPPTARAARWLRLVKLLLGIVASALTIARLLGAL
ncbi:hypothetical protein ATH50_1147 [Haloplanus aerogenes]|uniref:Uncharacterized protein n=1 Tax=Haloplanus aerogenes TaxID=660522 RepID=A0A3M0DQK3_9EURY|nr:hypothetical protein ATH50_1147 [Haloplanus aerogenes]